MVAVAAALAAILAACATAVDGAASYAGNGPSTASSSTDSVPDPSSDSSSSSETSSSSSPTATGPVNLPPDQQSYCANAYSLAGSFLPDWQAAVAGGPDVDSSTRQNVAASIDNSLNAAYPSITQITEPTVSGLFGQLLGLMHALVSDVAAGNAANLDQWYAVMDQIKSACSL